MSEHLEESDVLENPDSDQQSDDSCSSDALAGTGPSASGHTGLYLGPSDELSCGTHLTVPTASSSGNCTCSYVVLEGSGALADSALWLAQGIMNLTDTM